MTDAALKQLVPRVLREAASAVQSGKSIYCPRCQRLRKALAWHVCEDCGPVETTRIKQEQVIAALESAAQCAEEEMKPCSSK